MLKRLDYRKRRAWEDRLDELGRACRGLMRVRAMQCRVGEVSRRESPRFDEAEIAIEREEERQTCTSAEMLRGSAPRPSTSLQGETSC